MTEAGMTEAGWVRVGPADLPVGAMREVVVGGRSVGLFHMEDGRWAATDNICTHGQARLTEGWLDGTEIECPLHAGRFDIVTGEALAPPVSRRLAVHEVRVEGDGVFVRLVAVG